MIKSKRMIAIVALSIVVLLALGGVTIAYFANTTESVANIFSYGSIDVEVVEDFTPPTGNEATKKVQVQNTGKSDAYARAVIVPTFRDGTASYAGKVDYSKVKTDGYILVHTPDGGGEIRLILASGWSTNWHFANDVFYYKKVLKHGQNKDGDLTDLLLERVTLTGSNNWQGLEVEVLAEAVQASGDAVAEYLKNNWGVTSIAQDGTLNF